MAGPDKPYRVYKSGRTLGRVPLRSKPGSRPRGSRDGDGRKPDTTRPRRPRKRWGWGRRIGVGLAVVVLLVVVWGVLSFLSFRGGVAKANKRVGAATKAALNNQDSLLLSNPTDVLLLGTDHANSDARANDQHSDSIMLVRTDPSHHRVAYLSIPRDLVVPIPGVGTTKINAAMQIGGPALAIKTVRAFTGVEINHVIVVNFADFKDLIDALGGVTFRSSSGSAFPCRLGGDFGAGGNGSPSEDNLGTIATFLGKSAPQPPTSAFGPGCAVGHQLT